MLTENSLKRLKSSLLELQRDIDYALLPSSTHEKLYKNEADYVYAHKFQNLEPQNYYNFRYLDYDLYLFYNKKDKFYYLRSDFQHLSKKLSQDFTDAKFAFIKHLEQFLFNDALQQLELF